MNDAAHIIQLEAQLLDAVKRNDVAMLEKLLHDDLLFILPNGQPITKDMDLATYRSGNMSIQSASVDEQKIQFIDDAAVVSVVVELQGRYFEQQIDGRFRYLRVWKQCLGEWKVIAGSSTML